MGEVAGGYDHDFFFMHTGWRDEYEAIADILAEHLPFRSVLDIGCGNGYIVQRLDARGWRARGIDGSKAVLPYYPGVQIADLCKPLHEKPRDLVICTEVAEHLQPEFADTLVESVARCSRKWIFWSAAQPGHGGYLHLNEQAPEYWLDKFGRLGFHVGWQRTDAIRKAIAERVTMAWWFAANGYVLAR